MSTDQPPADADVARLFAPVAVEATFAGVLTEAAGILGQIDDPVDAELWGSDLIGALAASAAGQASLMQVMTESLVPAAEAASTWNPWPCCGSWPRSARPACGPPPGRPRRGYRPAAWPTRPGPPRSVSRGPVTAGTTPTSAAARSR